MLLKALIYLPVVFLVAGTASILVYGSRTRSRIYFVIFSYLLALWALFTFVADVNSGQSQRLFFLQLALLMGTLLTASFPFFGAAYINKKLPTWSVVLLGAITAVLVVFNFSSLMVSEVSSVMGVQPTKFGPLYQVQSLYSIVALFASIAWLYRGTKKSPVERSKVRLILYGLTATVFINFLTGYIFALNGKSDMVGVIGPPSFLLFFFATYISISRYRIFDVRRYLFRFIIYVATLGLLVAIISLITNTIDVVGSLQTRYILLPLALIAFNPLRLQFQKLTNHIFFRGEYEVGREVNQVLRLMLRQHDSAKLLHSVLGYVQERTSLVSLEYKNKKTDPVRGIAVAQGNSPVFMLGKDSDYYVLAGDKLNGSALTTKDRELIEATAKNLGIVLKNIEYTERITKFNETLQVKIDEATASLQASNESLNQLSVTKDEFMSMATHQIRPQLTAVRGFLDMLQQSRITKDQKELLEYSSNGVERTLRVITDMLNLSRFSSGELRVEKQNVDLLELLQNEIHALKPLLKTAGMSVVDATEITAAPTWADEIKTREVIANFCHNAIQYGKKGKKIIVQITLKQDMYEFTVRDFGIGVPQNEAAELFQKFYRTSTAKDARPAGTGVGLFLAKTVIEAQGGTVFFRSEDKGSTFGFTLPIVGNQPNELEI